MNVMNIFDYFFEESKSLQKDFVLGSSERASFQKIYLWSLQLAGYLQATVGENNRIILMSQNSVFFIVSYLGIMKSGNICVPLNPILEQENLNYIISLTDCRLCFISEQVLSFRSINISVINETNLDSILIKYKKYEIDSLDIHFDEKRIAEIIFTSGSTGSPKGVMLSHRNLRTNTNSIIEYLALLSNDIMTVVLPFYYCYGLSILHTHLKVGASMVLNNNFALLGTVINNMLEYHCTGFAGVPSHFQILLRKSKTFKSTIFPDLRYVTQAGGKLHSTFINEFTQTFPNIDFYVMYGQTEATARLAFLPPNLLIDKIGSIGKAIPGVILQVVNSNLSPVKPGETGEIVAKGDNVMIGYFNDEDATSEVLKNGWLFTGDMATVDDEGFIYLVARKKEIMKIAGNRISPKEIEEVILSVPEVLDCTVEEVNDELQGAAIKATIVLTDSYDLVLIKEKIVKSCREKLSAYKIPRFWEFTEKLQLTPTGKKMKNVIS
jgi:acyl-CoA synthetase (AMP-forming)/AMP-acid ligase II